MEHDEGGGLMTQNVIKRLSETLDAAQHALEELRVMSGCVDFPKLPARPEHRHQVAYDAAVQILADRRARTGYFSNPDMFGEPAWDILLDLYIHQFQNDDVSVKNACVGSGASANSALLWLKLLEERGLIFTDDDPTDQKRKLVRLTSEGYESMTRYLNDIVSMSRPEEPA